MEASLPGWAEIAGGISILVITISGAVYNYFKTNRKENPTVDSISSTGTNRILKDMLEAMREFQDESNRDMKRTQRFIHDLQESINGVTETLQETNFYLKEGKLFREGKV